MAMSRESERQSAVENLQALAELEAKRIAIGKSADRLRNLQGERDAAEQEVQRLSTSAREHRPAPAPRRQNGRD